jgi:cation:H+ antiporter
MIQATVPSAFGLFFTPWLFDTPLMLAAVFTMAAVAYLLIVLRLKRLTSAALAGAALFYVGFAVALVIDLT